MEMEEKNEPALLESRTEVEKADCKCGELKKLFAFEEISSEVAGDAPSLGDPTVGVVGALERFLVALEEAWEGNGDDWGVRAREAGISTVSSSGRRSKMPFFLKKEPEKPEKAFLPVEGAVKVTWL